jgi:hypothetical protein
MERESRTPRGRPQREAEDMGALEARGRRATPLALNSGATHRPAGPPRNA